MNKLHQVVKVQPLLAPNMTPDFVRQNGEGLAGLALLFPLAIVFSVSTAERLLSAVSYLFSI
ncbi:hypothetical protein BCF11_1320 [Collimonas sp. PA-H2]|uniref:hypothetical protein n=1 Tax=Collimonas sp. PA-H2 TaxID=1881062 RepID=UPI000BFA6492|nr:hypothetical protein [Collimonas sp. PA-H2]PFH08941.1 hypothetical protein BCF11_1320 [Collimonas sp. PA-H2]